MSTPLCPSQACINGTTPTKEAFRCASHSRTLICDAAGWRFLACCTWPACLSLVDPRVLADCGCSAIKRMYKASIREKKNKKKRMAVGLGRLDEKRTERKRASVGQGRGPETRESQNGESGGGRLVVVFRLPAASMAWRSPGSKHGQN